MHCCSTLSKIEVTKRKNASLKRTSQKCRRSCCPRCNQIRASKYKSRFIKCFNSPETAKFFKKKYFYFITFTVKHNTFGTRTEVYLEELKSYIKKIRRSKFWKKNFPYSKKNPRTGFAESYEMTLTPNGYHIHCHIMICTDPLVIRFNELTDNLRKSWKKITKDSDGVDFQKVTMTRKEIKKIRAGKPSQKFVKLISEVFKYTVKLGDIHTLDEHDTDKFADWLIKTKSKNMIIAGGFFRGFELFGRQSKWDEPKQEQEDNSSLTYDYFVGRTSHLKFNISTNKHFSKYEREYQLSQVYLSAMTNDFINIANTGQFFDRYLNMCIDPSENRWGKSDIDRLERWVIVCELEQAEKQFYKDMEQPLNQDFINQANMLYLTPKSQQLEFQY